MATYHVNPLTGEVGKCNAVQGQCPFGGETGTANHYATKQEAVKAAEQLAKSNHDKVTQGKPSSKLSKHQQNTTSTSIKGAPEIHELGTLGSSTKPRKPSKLHLSQRDGNDMKIYYGASATATTPVNDKDMYAFANTILSDRAPKEGEWGEFSYTTDDVTGKIHINANGEHFLVTPETFKGFQEKVVKKYEKKWVTENPDKASAEQLAHGNAAKERELNKKQREQAKIEREKAKEEQWNEYLKQQRINRRKEQGHYTEYNAHELKSLHDIGVDDPYNTEYRTLTYDEIMHDMSTCITLHNGQNREVMDTANLTGALRQEGKDFNWFVNEAGKRSRGTNRISADGVIDTLRSMKAFKNYKALYYTTPYDEDSMLDIR